jgi:pimeloyl-ACP methyl ester carboxylesterase
VTNVLLIHGAGASSHCWRNFRLPDEFPIRTIDLHSPWTWESMLDQIEELGLDNPAVVGQSLGGAVAVRWAKRHPECPAVVNLDGNGIPDTFPGLSQSEVDIWQGRLKEVFDQMTQAMDPDLRPIQDLVAKGSVRELYDDLTVPALAVVSTRLMEPQKPFAEYYTAFQKGVLADLAGREDVVEFDGSHNMLAEKPAHLAALVTDFLRAKTA